MCVIDVLSWLRRHTLATLFTVSIGLLQLPVQAASSVTLGWDASTDPSVTSYNLYYGTASGSYSNSMPAGAATSASLSGLLAGTTYYFAATAVNSAGLESPFSNETSYTTPAGPVNQPPTLDAIANVTINEDALQQTVGLTGISSGAISEIQTLTVSASSSNPNLVSNPTVTYTSANTTGSLAFTPVANGFGTATITVTVNDGQSANNTISRTFTVTVNAVNDPPTLDALGNLTIAEDAGTQTVNLSGITSGTANESQTLTVTATSSNPALIPTPSVTYASPSTTGSLSFTPVANASGTATITVTANDGQAANNTISRTFTVTVNAVNDPPTLNTLGNLTINQDSGAQTVNLSGITSGAANENQTLTVTANSSNPTLIPNPSVSYATPNTTGSIIFTPAAGASGNSTISVTVNDGQAQNNTITRTFTVTVNPVATNQPPTLDVISNVTINEDDPQQTLVLTGISSGATNESQTLTVSASSSDPTLVPNPTVSYTSPNTSGNLAFTPVANGFGTATITVTVNDGQSANNTISRTFTVTVNAVNDPPTLNALGNLTIAEDAGAQTVNLSGITSGAANESQTLTVAATSSNPALIPTPSLSYTSPSTTGSLSFTPVANASGTATITVTVNDGQAANNTISRTFTVTVNAVNDPPTLNTLGNLTINQDSGAQTVNLSGITSGAANENQTLAVTATSSNPTLIPSPSVSYASPSTTGSITFTPAAGATGSSTISVTVNDGQAQNNTITRTFTVTVNAVSGNLPPTLDPINDVTINENGPAQNITLTGITSGSASENQPLSVSASSTDPGLIANLTTIYGTPSTSGTLVFSPGVNAYGSATITVTVNDGQAQNNAISRSFNVTVRPVNQPPTLSPLSNVTINEDAGSQTVNLSGISSGAANEQQALTVTARSSNPNLIPNPSVSYGSPAATGSLSFTPVPSSFGLATITVTVNDGQASNNIVTRTFNVTVNGLNDPPTLDPIANLTINENDGSQIVALTGITAGPTNEVQALTVTASSSDASLIPGTWVTYTSPSPTGSLAFAPASNAVGNVIITVTVSDGQLTTNRSFAVTILPGGSRPDNTPPTISAIADQTISQDTATAALPFIVGDAETAASALTLSAASDNQALAPDGNILVQGTNGNRTVTITPAPGQYGFAHLTLTVSDGSASNSVSFGLTVQGTAPSVVVSWTGNGMVTPNLSGQTLTPGNTYSLTAVPNPGQVFCGWSGSLTSAAPRISFVLNTSLVFQAHFDPLTIITNGLGTLSTNLALSRSLVEGQTYSVTALPKAGQVFAGWTGSYTSSAPKLTFVMSDDTVLIANFIPSPYPVVAGSYNGLFYEDDNGVQQYSAGFVNLAVTASGSYSGSLRFGPNKVGFSGRLGIGCAATNMIRLNSGTNLLLMFGVGTGPQANRLFGRIGGGWWAANLWGDRAVFNATTNPCPYAASYTLLFPRQDDDPSLPMGQGFGTVKVSASGTALFAGTLADGTKISQSVPVSGTGAWPLFASLYSGRGLFMSWMNFRDRATDDINGVVDWIKLPNASASYYPGGFAVESKGAGSVYVAPPNTTTHILNLNTATVDFSGGYLAAEFANSIRLGPSSQVSNLSANWLSLTFSLTTGTFSGAVSDPSSGLTRSFSGAVFQKLNNGAGMLFTAHQTSRLLLGP